MTRTRRTKTLPRRHTTPPSPHGATLSSPPPTSPSTGPTAPGPSVRIVETTTSISRMDPLTPSASPPSQCLAATASPTPSATSADSSCKTPGPPSPCPESDREDTILEERVMLRPMPASGRPQSCPTHVRCPLLYFYSLSIFYSIPYASTIVFRLLFYLRRVLYTCLHR